jgi:hypothetical protein
MAIDENSPALPSNPAPGNTNVPLPPLEVERISELEATPDVRPEIQRASEIGVQSGPSPFDAKIQNDDTGRSDSNNPYQTQSNGSGVRTDPWASVPNRCAKPEDFPDTSTTTPEKLAIAGAILSIAKDLIAIGATEGIGIALTAGEIAIKGALIGTLLDGATGRGKEKATVEQNRCYTERQERQENKLRERSFYKRSF